MGNTENVDQEYLIFHLKIAFKSVVTLKNHVVNHQKNGDYIGPKSIIVHRLFKRILTPIATAK